MTRTPRRRPAATAGVTALLALAALTGCAQEEPTNDEVSSSAPAVDDAVTTSDDASVSEAPDEAVTTSAGPDEDAATSAPPVTLEARDGSFSVEVPGRWEDALDLVDDDSILVAAKDTERIDDFFTNVVVTEEEPVPNLTEAVEDSAQELAGEDGEYELLEPAEVDGDEAPGYTIVRELQQPDPATGSDASGATDEAGGTGATVSVRETQRWVSHDESLYVVTFSAVESQAGDAAALLDEIMASWSWDG